jgi:hypothetical protein
MLETVVNSVVNEGQPETAPETKAKKKAYRKRRTTKPKLTGARIRDNSKSGGAYGLRVAYLGGFLDRRSRDWRLDAGPEERRWAAFFGVSRLEELPLDIQNSIHDYVGEFLFLKNYPQSEDGALAGTREYRATKNHAARLNDRLERRKREWQKEKPGESLSDYLKMKASTTPRQDSLNEFKIPEPVTSGEPSEALNDANDA